MTRRDNPYLGLPRRALWSRGVARGFTPAEVVSTEGLLLELGDRVASVGSCFASNIVPYIERAGLEYLRTEEPPEQVAMLPENLGYRDFSAAYGNVYTVRQMRQLLERAVGRFRAKEDRWHEGGVVVDPFRPGLAYPSSSDAEFDFVTASHLDATRRAFQSADVVIVTLGLTEGWESALDGSVFPTCPGTVGGTFNPDRHRFRNFTVAEVTEDLHALLTEIRRLNPRARYLITVSPVPLVATASGRHVLHATTYSKSVLHVAANQVVDAHDRATYFPAYELITGPQARETFFLEDRRSVSPEGIDVVMQALLMASGLPVTAPDLETDGVDRPSGKYAEIRDLGRHIAEAECDEELLDQARADYPEAP